MKISEAEMTKRVAFAREFFGANPDASVADLNKEFEKKGEPKMGAIAYDLHDQIKRVRRGKPAPAKTTRSLPPIMDEVTSMVGTLAKRLAGTNVKRILLDVSGEKPVIRFTELTPTDREVTLKS